MPPNPMVCKLTKARPLEPTYSVASRINRPVVRRTIKASEYGRGEVTRIWAANPVNWPRLRRRIPDPSDQAIDASTSCINSGGVFR
jgi:hypothetical protein